MSVSLVKDYGPIRPVGMLVELVQNGFTMNAGTVGRVTCEPYAFGMYQDVDFLANTPRNGNGEIAKDFPVVAAEIRPYK